MSDAKPEAHQNVYLQNVVTGATTNPVMQNPDAIDEEFIADRVLCITPRKGRFQFKTDES